MIAYVGPGEVTVRALVAKDDENVPSALLMAAFWVTPFRVIETLPVGNNVPELIFPERVVDAAP